MVVDVADTCGSERFQAPCLCFDILRSEIKVHTAGIVLPDALKPDTDDSGVGKKA